MSLMRNHPPVGVGSLLRGKASTSFWRDTSCRSTSWNTYTPYTHPNTQRPRMRGLRDPEPSSSTRDEGGGQNRNGSRLLHTHMYAVWKHGCVWCVCTYDLFPCEASEDGQLRHRLAPPLLCRLMHPAAHTPYECGSRSSLRHRILSRRHVYNHHSHPSVP